MILPDVPPRYLTLAGATGVFLSVQKVFDWMENHVSDSVIQTVRSWILRFDPAISEGTWPGTFSALFTTLFGKRQWSRRSACASVLATLCCVSLTELWNAYPPDWQGRLAVITTAFIINLLPDFLALWQTRYLVDWLGKRPSLWIVPLLTDLLLKSGIVIALFVTPAPELYHVFIPRQPQIPTGFFGDFAVLITSWVAVFGSSVWIWIYIGAGLILRILARSPAVIAIARHVLPIDEHPLRALGTVGGIIATGVYLSGAMFLN